MNRTSPRCALLHGFAGTPDAWDDVVASWQLPERPTAPMLPGHGHVLASSWHQNLIVIARLLGDLDVDVVVGYSLGARVALGLVVEGFIDRAVLISVNPGITDDERAERRASDARWAAMLRSEGLAAFEAAWTAQPLFASQARVPEELRARRRARRLQLDPEQLARSLETMGLAEMPDYRPQVGDFKDRLAVIAGADDAKYVAIGQALPCASFETIASSGHDPTLEEPVELAAAIARAAARLR